MNRDGTEIRQLTFADRHYQNPEDRYPVISPDGTRIAFISRRNASSFLQVFTINVDGNDLRPITDETIGFNAAGVAWSPDSTQLAASGYYVDFGTCHSAEGIKIINADGTGERLLACTRNGSAPAIDWSPDGTRIAFVDFWGLSGRDGPGISQVRPEDGTHIVDITPQQLGTEPGVGGGLNASDAGAFRYSPDSNRFVYASTLPGANFFGLSFINVDGTGRQDVINDRNYHHLWWQPGPGNLQPTALTLAPDPLVVGPSFPQQLSPVLKDSAGNILSRSAYGYCTVDARFAKPDQLGFVISPFAGGPSTPLVVTNAGLVSNVITALPQATDPPVSFHPWAWDFGNQSLGTSPARVFTLTNTGSAALNISSIAINGAADFTLDAAGSTCPLTGGPVGVTESCTINVIFTPSAVGEQSGQVTVSDDSTTSPHDLSLIGTGTVAP